MIHKFWWVVAILGFSFVLELAGGYFFGSLALISDSLHEFSDLFAICVSFSALAISQKKLPTDRMTYGYHRLEVFSAIFNGVLLVILALAIFFEAIHRLGKPDHEVMALPALLIGIVGFAANLAAAAILGMGREHRRDLNIRSVFWHILGDMLASLAVIFGMIGIMLTGNHALDAAVSIGIAALLVVNAAKVLIEGTGILLQQSPRDLGAIREKVRAIPHVLDIDDFRLWQVCSHLLIGTAHIITDATRLEETEELDRKIRSLLQEEYQIRHLTLQFETREMYERHRHEFDSRH